MTERTSTLKRPAGPWGRALAVLRGIPPIAVVFLIVFVAVGMLNPNFLTVDGVLTFLRRAAPTVILAMGSLFVIAAGGFDLSIGSLVTFSVIGGAMLIGNDPANAYTAILILLAFGIGIGLMNGLSVTYLKVPSLIATLGTLLMVRGLGLYWSGGAPRGYLTDNFRAFGRGFIEDLPLIGRFPISVIVLVVMGVIAYLLFHRANLGRQILAVGDNDLTARLSGVRVRAIRITTFVLSAIFAVVAGVLVGGFAGVNIEAGTGLELQAISAAVLGGAALLGGRGSVPGVIFGALTLEALFNLLNLLGLPKPLRDAVQGLIIISAATYIVYGLRRKR
jgi:ribose transport system permease protein